MIKLFRRKRIVELKEQEIAQRDRQIAQKNEELSLLRDRRKEEIEKREKEKRKPYWYDG